VLASRQHGVVSRAQCIAAGLTARSIHRRVEAGKLFVVHRGVYAVGHAGLTFEGRCMAAAVAVDGWASHRSAAALWSLRPASNETIDVVVRRRGGPRPGITAHRTTSLTDNDVTYRRKVPVTNLRRTLLDLADTAGPTEFEDNLRTAERIHRFDRDRLAEIHGRRGTKTLRASRPVVRGNLEPRFLAIVRNGGLPPPVTNEPVGRYVIDAVWWDAKVAVEVDDWDTHRTRHAFRNDRAKGNALAVAGLTLLRFTADDLDDPAHVVATLRAAGV
jgi:hypothetical protein